MNCKLKHKLLLNTLEAKKKRKKQPNKQKPGLLNVTYDLCDPCQSKPLSCLSFQDFFLALRSVHTLFPKPGPALVPSLLYLHIWTWAASHSQVTVEVQPLPIPLKTSWMGGSSAAPLHLTFYSISSPVCFFCGSYDSVKKYHWYVFFLSWHVSLWTEILVSWYPLLC